MKNNTKMAMTVLLTLTFMAALFVSVGVAADMTIKGIVSEDGKLLGENGNEYTIAENSKGMQVMGHAGESVTIRGTVTENEGVMVISVSSFSVEKDEEGDDRD